MPASSRPLSPSTRTVYGRSFRITPLWLWALQRASAVLLGPLVALHMWAPGWSRSAVLDMALLAIVAAHGYSGMVRIAPGRRTGVATIIAAILWCAVVLAFGLFVTWALLAGSFVAGTP
jgi:succinate dehydrogenase hydrophobic anchor subunit